METYKVKMIVDGRKTPQYKTLLAFNMDTAMEMLVNCMYFEICPEEIREKGEFKHYFHVELLKEKKEDEVKFNLFISRMDKGKEVNIITEIKKTNQKGKRINGLILSKNLYKCQGLWKG